MNNVDMSDKAVWRRLRQVDQLRELCLSLMKAKRVHDEKKAEEKRANAVFESATLNENQLRESK
ncbi:MAG: hypothetical protein H7Z37_09605 [Pyrinomonadaceae bacterium]|nr:hypothetical protein [Pyrinomonadaceae bacterium]